MDNIIGNMEEILAGCVSGFHQYVLTEPVRLCYVSRSLCGMLGFSEKELLGGPGDGYAMRVHPDDRARYDEFVHILTLGEQTRTAEYRLTKKDGSILFVSDTVTVTRQTDGTLIGHSVLTDITKLKSENEDLRFLTDTVPCGFLRFTCDKQPRITCISDRMRQMLRFPPVKDGEMDYLALCRENIYLVIPMEERRRFMAHLHRVYTQNAPAAGEMTLLRCDGTKLRLFSWITKCTGDDGGEEFAAVCMDITENHRTAKEDETKRYIRALTDVYDKIFAYDLTDGTVKCLYGQNSPVYKRLENIPMQMEDATAKWIAGTVLPEDRENVSRFFRAFFDKTLADASGQPPRIRYRALSSDGSPRTYTGIFLQIDTAVSLFCCRRVTDEGDAASLVSENASLRKINENMQEMVMRFTEGIAAFEITEDTVTPLYASDNVCEFFGFTRDEWMPLMKQSNSIKDFVSRSGVAYEAFVELLQNGEAEFTYHDISRGEARRIKAICSQKSPGGASPRYVMLYNVDEADREKSADRPAVSIRTFGYFDVFVGEKPIAFRSQKSKELFALLVDRRGGYVSSEEAISFLWEEESVNAVTLSRYRKVALRLKNILEEYGIADVVESVDGKRRIVPDRVRCDLYDYLSGREEHAQLFKGSYLTNYSWGETTLGELIGEHIPI